MAVIFRSYLKVLPIRSSSAQKSICNNNIYCYFNSNNNYYQTQACHFFSCYQHLSSTTRIVSRRKISQYKVDMSNNCSFQEMSSGGSKMIAAIQITSSNQKEDNIHLCNSLIEKAVNQHNTKMVFLPEGFDFIASSREETITLAESINGPVITNYRNIAKKLNVWLSLGGFHEKQESSVVSAEEAKIFNVHLVIDNEGNIVSRYEKVHLFDVCLPEKNIDLRESRTVHSGNEIIKPVETPVGVVGLSICYDLRFPEISERLRKEGAEILTYPSAFTVHTGRAHWEIILRARAIENQCYVVAAAQVGVHNHKRSSYGNSMIIDPWGSIIAHACDDTQLIFAEINLENLLETRKKMPIAQHKRFDVYSKGSHKCTIPMYTPEDVFDFGPNIKIKTKLSFLESEYSRAFVNAKCILPGHVLVISKRIAPRLHHLYEPEITDLFLLVQKVEIIMESIQGSTSANVASQDGKDAGQSIPHVHVHVLPRRPGDFARNDDVYQALEDHGKVLKEPEQKWRPEDEMFAEAEHIRSVIKQNFSHYLK